MKNRLILSVAAIGLSVFGSGLIRGINSNTVAVPIAAKKKVTFLQQLRICLVDRLQFADRL